MLPRTPLANMLHCGPSNAVFGSDVFNEHAAGVLRAHGQNDFVVQYCVLMVGAAFVHFWMLTTRVLIAASEWLVACSTLRFCVLHIGGTRPEKKMRGVNASGGVTPMAHIKMARRFTPGIDPVRKAMRANLRKFLWCQAHVNSAVTSSRFVPAPHPAFIRTALFKLFPEPLKQISRGI